MTDSLTSPDTELQAYLEALLTLPPEPAQRSPTPEPVRCPPSGKKPAADGLEASSGPPLPPGCPDGLGARFPVLRFRLGNLRFAAPLAHLRGAWEINADALRPLSGPGLVGEMAQLGEDWIVLDTAALIVSGGRLEVDYRWALPTALGTFALACEAVEREIDVAASQVRWREDQSRRPWLLGMVGGTEKCPLLDIEILVADWQARSQK
ncbi:purine-binding chemotaxis protein CheW [Methylomarinovum caldicuralii]|uniref:Purine-binding chemotaxis protein CheW n=1 Tax=Methylomarinovum caldicuralii TaxID=438856 RepID=A0AAU9C334_9GAMM|nr:hypothetical protein [Methylomarinovum caldicuralii]BCX81600.1 purine-binding chemotaxis protein CheW [Methylomarinovum caldicuralii]